MHSIRVELEGEEIAILKRVRAFGFSSNAEVIRLATLAWTDHAARQTADGGRDFFAVKTLKGIGAG